MSIIIGNNCSSGAFVMVDKRLTLRSEGSYLDGGGKIVSTGQGWAVCSGHTTIGATAAFAALKALRDQFPERLDVPDPAERASAVVRDAVDGFDLDPQGGPGRPTSTVAMAEPGPIIDGAPTVALLTFRNAVMRAGRVVCTTPNGMAGHEAEFGRDLLERIGALAPDLPLVERIQIAAGFMDRAYRSSTTVSQMIDVGVLVAVPDGAGGFKIRRVFLQGQSDAIAASDPATLLDRFSGPAPTAVSSAVRKIQHANGGTEYEPEWH